MRMSKCQSVLTIYKIVRKQILLFFFLDYHSFHLKLFIAKFARIICPGWSGARINLLARTEFRSFDITRLSLSNKIKKITLFDVLFARFFFPLFLSDFDIFRKKKTYMAGIRFAHVLEHFKKVCMF